MDGVARAVCALKIPYIFLWRRNVLRRLISYDANRLDMKRRSGHHAHPTSETEANQQRSIKPHLNASGISHYIGLEITARQKAEKAFSKYCGAEDARSRIHYYEDLVDGAPQASAEWALVLKQLRTSPISATSAANFTIIRGKRPPLESVANPDEVRQALANSRHAWMLEEKDMFDRLKSTHAHSPPPRDP